MHQTLSFEGMNELVDFSYFPLNHIDPSNGSYVCSEGSDCDSVRFESCLVNLYCWFQNDKACPSETQLKVAHFMQCFEGPYANREVSPDPSRRPFCMEQASLDFDLVSRCAHDSKQVTQIEFELNETRAPMYKRLGPTPGLFPHIFLDGEHQWNNSWAALVRTLCEKIPSIEAKLPSACTRRRVFVSFDLNDTPVTRDEILAKGTKFESAVHTAMDYAASKVWLPVHFDTHEPDGAPSYVNIKAVDTTVLIDTARTSSSTVHVLLRVDILNGLMNSTQRGCLSEFFLDTLAWSLSTQGFSGITNSSIGNLSLVPFL